MRGCNFEGQATPWPDRNIATTFSSVPIATRGSFAREKRDFQRPPSSVRALPPRPALPSSARIRDGATWTWRKVRHSVNALQITSFRYLLCENARNRRRGLPFIDRGECDEHDSVFRFGSGYSHCNGTAIRAFRLYGVEETLMLFFMLPAIIFSGMWSVMLEAQDTSPQPQRLKDRTDERH
jgi:hypothetical protein